MPIYTLEPSRVIAKDGVPILILTRHPGDRGPIRYNVTTEEADAIAHRIVALLNSTKENR